MITRLLGSSTLPANTVTLRFNGSAGQSLGAFVPAGVTIRLEGDANDYVGKGLSGGRIVVRPAATATFASHENIIAGNVIGYGATSGELFLSGVVGERLGVRNSGATIVVEGSGDHACEYMTGGTVVILGKIGRNLAAGMSGGTVYLFDPNDEVQRRLSKGTYEVDPLDEHDEAVVLDIVTRFADETGSKVAQSIVDDWANRKQQFVRIETAEYQRARDGVHHG
jgi:glutamate synthase (NADPH/NADH) large chain